VKNNLVEANHNKQQSKDVFSAYKHNLDKFFNSIRQSVPQYHQAITNVQQEYLQTCENMTDSAVAFQKEVAKKSGVVTGVPEATIRVMDDATTEFTRMSSINNQVVLATIDATQQNIKTFNDNTKSFANLTKDVLQSWISAFTIKTN